MDADGQKTGYDLDLIRAIGRVVDLPIIASGGAGTVEHFADACAAGADAVLAASVFHFGQLSIDEVKAGIQAAGFPVRRLPATA
jgi:cyclase